MNAKAVLPMDSYRLAQYAVHVPCFICEGGNAFDAELCRHCQAPMAFINQASQQKQEPLVLATLGSSGAGKTVFLGTLIDMLSRQGSALHFTARGAFSVGLQQRTMSSLCRCEFPEKTPGEPDRWNWVYGQLHRPGRGQTTDLVMPDMAGESILQELEHPNTFPVVRAMLKKATRLLLLIDSVRVEEGETNQDFFAMKVLSDLAEAHQQLAQTKKKRKKGDGCDAVHLALVFTKADETESCFEDPQLYAKKHTPGLWQQCQDRFPHHRFFASGVAGACTVRVGLGGIRQRVPLRIEPRGTMAPFRWLIEQ
jgi:hypothetical protein